MSLSNETPVQLIENGANLSAAAKLLRIRSLMGKQGINALIVPTDDPHMSEYTAAYFGRREFISGFTGSAGTVIITAETALLFTDGRYHKQAEMQLSADWTLMKVGIKGVPNFDEHLFESLQTGAVVGIDPLVHSATGFSGIEKKLQAKGISVQNLNENLVDIVWADQRPPKPCSLVRLHELKFAGRSSADKMQEIRALLKSSKSSALVVTPLDEIAWLFNFRAADVPCNPVSVSYAVLGLDSAYLFIDAEKVPADMREYFASNGVEIKPYEDIVTFVQDLQKQEAAKGADGGKIWFDGKTVNWGLYNCIPSDWKIDKASPIIDMKACKNDAEMQGMRDCHLRDGAAVVEFMSWLDEVLPKSCNGQSEHPPITEVDIDLMVTKCRSEQDLYMERSFPSIAGVNDHGAIMHYKAEPETCKTLTTNDLLLLDSGGQYLDGTTDVTRTFHMGTPTDYQIEMFTRVLKGNIAVDSAVFPAGTPGVLLDTAARQFLWEIGKNYLHGTGHGVGAHLNVHEGPHRISPVDVVHPHPLKPGMITSIEPGYYENGNFGIRIENLVECVEVTEFEPFGGRAFLGFKKLTHIPLQRKLMKMDLLTEKELKWINDYHKDILDRVLPYLKTERARKWLAVATTPIVRQL